MQFQFELLFWLCALLLAYVYIGYPVFVGILAKFFPHPVKSLDKVEPSVSLIISAYNEAAVIAAKIENSLALAFPAERLEIIVVSDCCDDGTDEIVRGYAGLGVRLIRQNQRLGKSAALNYAVPQARGNILVFSDANSLYLPDAVCNLVRDFPTPRFAYLYANPPSYTNTTQRPPLHS